MRLLASGLILNATFSYNAFAQTSPTELAQSAAPQTFNQEQLDSLVASIALYPDELLTQVLMASTFPLEVVAAARWVEDPSHKSLSGDALTKALTAESWDPSVKSLVPFPLVLATMNSNLTWLQQLGYAFASQQADVFAAVQRVRQLARANDKLKSTPQQVVTTEQVTVEAPAGSGQTQREVIVIQPAQSNTVYVPAYDPNVVYGSSWPSTSYPPYYAVPPAGYNFGAALATGMTFAAGAAIVGGLWGWARPAWGGGYANVNVNTFNSINASRPPLNSSRWAATTVAGHPGNVVRPPGGPVGLPGRPQVSVPGSAVRPPTRPVGAGNVAGVGRPGGPGGVAGVGRAGRPGGPGGVAGVGGAGRPGGPGGVAGVGGAGRPSGPGGIAGGGGVGRPGGMGGAAGTGRPGGGGGAATPGQLPARGGQGFAGAQRPGGAFGDMNSGRNAGQFGQRGAQSRTIGQQRSFAGGGAGSFGGGRRAGGGRGRR